MVIHKYMIILFLYMFVTYSSKDPSTKYLKLEEEEKRALGGFGACVSLGDTSVGIRQCVKSYFTTFSLISSFSAVWLI